jgi:pimeloyl-ACP methyl ester carboxylesterase
MQHDGVLINSARIGRSLDVGGPSLHYVEDGVGPPMVLLHGLGFSLYTYRKVIEPLACDLRVVAADLPGCGYSTLPDGCSASCEAMAQYLKSLLESLAIHHAVVCGAGEGGIYAMELACRYPELVDVLILVSPGSLTRHYPLGARLLANRWLGPWAVKAINPDRVGEFLRWCCFSEIDVDSLQVREVYQPFENTAARKSLLRLIKGYDDHYVHEHMKGFIKPVLIVWGEDDPARQSSMAEFYHAALPQSQVKVLRNCGMLPQEEKHKEFVSEIFAFLGVNMPGQLVDLTDDKP